MKKKSIIAAMIVLFVAAAAVFLFFFSYYEEKETVSEKVQKKEGVYYNALSIKEIGLKYDGMALYAYDSLFYKNKIYTSDTNRREYSTEEFVSFSEKIISLGKVYDSHGVYASIDSSLLYEVTGMGTLFRLKEYEEDSRVGIYRHYEEDSVTGDKEHYTVQIYDCLNDIWVKQGKEVFQTMFHLEDAESIELIAGYDEEGERKVKKKVTFQNDVISDFFDAVCEGEFLEAWEREKTILSLEEEDRSEREFLLFTDKYGIQTELYVYREGYVLYRSPEETDFIVRVDGKKCEGILNMYSM